MGGSLQRFENAILNQGGEVEKRRAFVLVGTLPAYTHGLFGLQGQLHTFGTAIFGPPDFALPVLFLAGSPVPVNYHKLDPVVSLARVFDVEVYGGKFWVGGADTAGIIWNWWDGTLRADGHALYSRVYQSKMYRADGTLLRFSSVDNPNTDDNTTANPGGGFIDLSKNDSEVENLSGIEVYYNQLAVFARYATQLWAIDPDPAQNALKQVLRIGSIAGHAIRQFGTGDVLFLSDNGIRSLRALNLTLAAGVIDVGSPIDKLVIADIAADFAVASAARSIVEPITGRFWLAIGQKIYVLSFYPSAKISAWSVFTVPFVVESFAIAGNQLFVLDTDRNVYLYGGTDGVTYDSSLARIRTPHLSADKPSIVKKMQSLSAVLFGDWSISLGMVTDNTELFEPVANVSGPTTVNHRISVAGHGTHVAVELTSSSAAAGTVASLAINHEVNEKL